MQGLEEGSPAAAAAPPAAGAAPVVTAPSALPPSSARARRARAAAPAAMVVATVAVNLWNLRASTIGVAYLNDSSVQEQMVRFAAARLRAGHDPLTSWYPFLGLGSPQFLHYQSTESILTGLAGILLGPNTAFRWSLYLLVACWPIVIFLAARVFGLRPFAAAAAAALSPLLASVPGVAYEPKAYLWIGYGVWAQLWASWALPFAWAFTWRAMGERRFVLPAAVAVAATAALHFESGYLAFLAVVVLPFLVPSDLRERVVNAALVGAGAFLASAWVIVPLVAQGRWASINEALQGGPLVNGYGARQVLGWLATGRQLDNGHFPIITVLAGAGAVISVLRWRSEHPGRALVVLTCVGLVLSFGRTTFGALANALPGGTDVFFRRFAMGTQLGALFLAGLGAAALASYGRAGLAAAASRLHLPRRTAAWLPTGLVVAVGLVSLFPAWHETGSYASANARDVHLQAAEEKAAAGEIDPMIAYVKAHGGGRVYAGMPSNWGKSMTVGFVPVYEYLASRDVDVSGFTLRTASLMTQPEYNFDETDAGDYQLFGVRYMILEPGSSEGVAQHLVMENSAFSLYVLPGNGYARVVDTVGTVEENRTDIGRSSISYLESTLPGLGRYYTVAYAGGPAAQPTAPTGRPPAGPPGEVLSVRADLAGGAATVIARLNRPAVVVLAASYDPGWSATVDGAPVPTEMLRPALVGVEVGRGAHVVVFRYVGYSWYPELWALALVDLAGLFLLTTAGGRRAARGTARLLRGELNPSRRRRRRSARAEGRSRRTSRAAPAVR
jgi:hypothetical protein